MSRLLHDVINDKTTEGSGWKIRRIEEGAMPIKRIQYKKEANLVSAAILKNVDTFLRASWSDPEADIQDQYHNRAEYIADVIDEFAPQFLKEFQKELESRMDAIVAARYKT